MLCFLVQAVLLNGRAGVNDWHYLQAKEVRDTPHANAGPSKRQREVH
jgi:hypothetical protein